MGVHELWPILEPVKKHVPLQSLSGKTLAVDLSIWVCEAQSVKQMVGVVAKPHLRNLFFRVSSLNLMGVKLVFVTEGEAPKVKADTMNKRNELRYGATKKTAPARPGRSYFKSVLKECLRMLDCLGVPWVQAAGEAEAMCAYLDANGYVDGCITNDGDVFLYGAQTVYRNFTMNVKDPHVDCYEVSNIRDRLGLDRESLVGLAILLGCDYIPKGLPGVGRELAMKFIKSLNGESILQRFYQWRKQFEEDPAMNPKSVKKKVHCTVCSHPGSAKEHERKGCILCGSEKYCEPHDYDYCCPCDWHKAEQEKKNNSLEYTLKMKAKKREGFPYPEVIKEFLRSKDKLVKVIKWMRPRLLCFQNFALEWMEWPKHYSCEKVLGLVTYYDMHERKAGRKHDTQLQAVRIVKTRVRNGIPCFEIEWVKPDGYVFPDDHPPDGPLLSIEDECLFTEAYPEVVQLFRKDKLEAEMLKQKCKKSKPKPKVPTNMDDVALLLSEMSLTPSVETNVSPWIEEEREEPETTTCLEGSDQRIELNGTAGPSPSKVTLSRAGTAGPSHPKVTLSRAGTAGPSHPKVTLSRAGTAGPSPPKVTLLSRAGTAAPSLPKVTLISRDPEISATPLCIEDDIDKNGEQCSSPAPCKPESSMASPNVSSMIADLQLSSIDWDGTSFSMSPQTDPHASSGQTHGMKAGLKAGEPVKANFNVNHPTQENVDAHKVSNSKPKVLTLPDSPCSTHLQRLPLRERLLLKNASQCASFEPPVNLEKHLPSKPIHQSLNIKDATKSSSNHAVSAKENIQSYKISNPTKELKSEKHINVTKKSNPNCWAPECPTTKSFKFVKKTPLVPVRLVSDGNLSSKTVSESLAKVTQKKSVCHKVVSSSEDEDEQGSGGRPKHVFKKECTRSEMPISKLAPVRPATNKEPEPYSIPSIDNLLDDVFSSPEGKVLPGKSPVELSDDDDDSIISVDSPLPLSERLKLRLLQNC